MLLRTDVSFKSIVCAACQSAMKFDEFRVFQGVCSCGGQIFDVALKIRKHYKYDGSAPGCRGEVPALKLAGFVSDLAAAANELNSNDHITGSVESSEYTLTNLNAPTVFAIAEAPPENVLDFISGLRKLAAQKNLRPGMAVCKQCESVFKIAHAGPSAFGYCSKICQSQYERENPVESPTGAAPAKAAITHCPKCGKSTKLRPGKKNVCMWCQAALD